MEEAEADAAVDGRCTLPPCTADRSVVEEIPKGELQLENNYIGRGAYGTVYKALWRQKVVAVKMMSEMERKSFCIELKQLSRINHENIVKLYGGSMKQEPYLVMEYCESGSLDKVLHPGPLPHYNAGHAISWALQCAKGVNYLHGLKIVHRDLKPPNLLLTNRGRHLKIGDFGTARDLQTCMTNNQGSAPCWGIILWEVLARRKPFDEVGRDPFRVMWAVHKGSRPPLIRGCPIALEILMTSCWKKDPVERPNMTNVLERMTYLKPFFQGEDIQIEANNDNRSEPYMYDSFSTDEDNAFEFPTQQMLTETTLQITDERSTLIVGDETISGATLLPYDVGDLVILPEIRPMVQPVVEEAPFSSLHSAPASLACSDENLHSVRLDDTNTTPPLPPRKKSVNKISPLAVHRQAPQALIHEMINIQNETHTAGDSVDRDKKKGHRRGGSYDTALLLKSKSDVPASANNNIAAAIDFERPFEHETSSVVRQSQFSRKDLHLNLLNTAAMGYSAEESSTPDTDDSTYHVPMAYLLLDPHLQPLQPCRSSKESVAIFKEHCLMAEEYLKIQEEIGLLVKAKQKLMGELDQDIVLSATQLDRDYDDFYNEKVRLTALIKKYKAELEELRKRQR